MARNRVANLPSPYYILQVDQIPTSVTLYQLLSRIAPYSRHIVGIARTADYHEKRLGRTIFFYCTSVIDARFISQSFIDFVGDGRDAQACIIIDSVIGRASLTHIEMENRFHQTPVTVHIKGLERQTDGSTLYLMRILPRFEINAAVTAFRLNYDVRRRMTCNYGFITFLNESEGRAIGGVDMAMEHTDRGRVLSCLLSDNVPMIVQIPDSNIFVNGICEWNEEAERVNQLILQRRVPVVSAQKVEFNFRPVASSSERAEIKQPTVSSIIVRPPQANPQIPSTSTAPIPSTSTAPNPTTSASEVKASVKLSIPASGNEVIKRPAINGWLKSQNKARHNSIDKLSTKAVYNKKKATTKKKEELVYDSSEEEILLTKAKVDKKKTSQRMTRAARQQLEKPVTAPESEDEGRLIIDEEVKLPEEDDELPKDV